MNDEEKPKKKHPVLKVLLVILLIIIVAVGIGAFYLFNKYKEYSEEIAEAQKGIIGTEVPDFKVTTTEGEEITLSGILKEKEVVILNIFATWCGPCEIEFPEFENNYRKYNDKMEIISLSGDLDDTMEDIAAYKKDHGLNFPMGSIGEGGTFGFVPVSGYPTTMSGTIRSGEAFEALVTSFMGDEYDGSPVYLYQVNSHNGKEYVGGATLKFTSDDGTERELTTDEKGYAYFMANEMHTYDVAVVSVPDGYALEKLDPQTTGPQSGYVIVQMKAK